MRDPILSAEERAAATAQVHKEMTLYRAARPALLEDPCYVGKWVVFFQGRVQHVADDDHRAGYAWAVEKFGRAAGFVVVRVVPERVVRIPTTRAVKRSTEYLMTEATIPRPELVLKRGDLVRALKPCDEGAAAVRPGDRGVVFDVRNAYGDDGGPMVRWFSGTMCNVYPEHGDVELVRG